MRVSRSLSCPIGVLAGAAADQCVRAGLPVPSGWRTDTEAQGQSETERPGSKLLEREIAFSLSLLGQHFPAPVLNVDFVGCLA